MKILLFLSFLLSQFHEFGNLKYFLYSPVAFSPGSLELRGPDSSFNIVKKNDQICDKLSQLKFIFLYMSLS